jgi:hypothetical protein
MDHGAMTISALHTLSEQIIDFLRESILQLDGVAQVVIRSLRRTDENGTIGLLPTTWRPLEYEIGGRRNQPSQVRMEYQIQFLVKHESEEEGAAVHRAMSMSLLGLLYDNEAFGLSFGSLAVIGDSPARIQRWSVAEQRYAGGEIEGMYVGMSATELNIDIQTV